MHHLDEGLELLAANIRVFTDDGLVKSALLELAHDDEDGCIFTDVDRVSNLNLAGHCQFTDCLDFIRIERKSDQRLQHQYADDELAIHITVVDGDATIAVACECIDSFLSHFVVPAEHVDIFEWLLNLVSHGGLRSNRVLDHKGLHVVESDLGALCDCLSVFLDVEVSAFIGTLLHVLDTVHLDQTLQLVVCEASKLVLPQHCVQRFGNRPRDGSGDIAQECDERRCALCDVKLLGTDADGLRNDFTDQQHGRNRDEDCICGGHDTVQKDRECLQGKRIAQQQCYEKPVMLSQDTEQFIGLKNVKKELTYSLLLSRSANSLGQFQLQFVDRQQTNSEPAHQSTPACADYKVIIIELTTSDKYAKPPVVSERRLEFTFLFLLQTLLWLKIFFSTWWCLLILELNVLVHLKEAMIDES